ncbi:cell wall integrity and stress response component 1-like [Pimephales promelas]|uniref:cell wall integrity and stress response component 1-like n=1 Tax=Pimephales promelas TaxID=90988 RepID=UPI001955ACF1|nr:cell wall integrity and stress response component 1-like [Pimephales promelas]
MSDQCDLCLLGLIILSSLLTGTSGDDHVFISSGVDVSLSCNKHLSDCKSTSWTYSNSFGHSWVELITGGIKNKDTERHERLSLESDCSLNIKNVTGEDYGVYRCRQYVNYRQQVHNAGVFLHVLHVSVSPSSSSSSSSSQTEISPGRSVTLSCQLYLYSVYSCDVWVSSGVELLWVNQAGVDLKTDSRYQISSSSSSPSPSSSSSSPDHCIITLTTTLLDEDDNREWRCQLTLRNQVQTSVRYTVKYSAQADSTTAVNPVHITHSQDPSTINTHVSKDQADSTTPGTNSPAITVIGISVAAVAVLLLALLWLICRNSWHLFSDNKVGTGDSAVKDEDEHKGTYETINMSIPPDLRADEQTDDVTYSEVSSFNTKPVKSLDDHDTVTYAAIRGREDKPQDQLYKNKTFTNTH